jgi:DNA-binding response OmpR family regulator
MRQAQVLLYETDGRLAKLLQPLFEQQRWRLRELRQTESVADALRDEVPLLILKIGRNLYEEMVLLEHAHWNFPETAIVVVGEVAHPELEGLTWDLGADFALFPPLPREHLVEIVKTMMARSGEA